VVLSTYSLCPVADPAASALELYRVTRPGGMIGIAHSTEPSNPLVRWLADKVENIAWRLAPTVVVHGLPGGGCTASAGGCRWSCTPRQTDRRPAVAVPIAGY